MPASSLHYHYGTSPVPIARWRKWAQAAWLWLLFAVSLVAVGSEDERGYVPVRTIPFAAEDGVRRLYALVEDLHGRLVVANGRVGIYDGFTMQALPLPGGVWTAAVDVDGHGRIWVGNSAELGFYAQSAGGDWEYISVRDKLPADVDYDLVWSVHCVGAHVFFLSSHEVMVWDGNAFTVEPLPTQRRLFGTSDADYLHVWQRMPIVDPGLPLEIRLWRFDSQGRKELRLERKGNYVPYDVLRDEDEAKEFVVGGGAWVQVKQDQWSESPRLAQGLIPVSVKRVNETETVCGTPSEGLVWINRGGEVIRRMSVESGELPNNTIEVLHRASNGQLWGLTPRGLVSLEADPAVTVWQGQHGISLPVRSLRRVGQSVLVGTESGLFRIEPADDGGVASVIRYPLKPEEGIVHAIEYSPALGLLTVGQTANNAVDAQWDIGTDHFQTGRAVLQMGPDTPWIVFAHSRGLVWRGVSAEGKNLNRKRDWPVVSEIELPILDQAWRLDENNLAWVDQRGVIERIELMRDSRTSGRMIRRERLTSEQGIGPVIRVQMIAGESWVFTRDSAWVWRGGASQFEPVAVSGAAVVPLAIVPPSGQDGVGWVFGEISEASSGQVGGPYYAVHRLRHLSGDRLEVESGSHAIIKDVGSLRAFWADEQVSWLGGSEGLVRVDLGKLQERLSVPSMGPPEFNRALSNGRDLFLTEERTRVPSGGSWAVEWYAPIHHQSTPVRFETRLDPLEADWVSTTETRREFVGLAGGDYTFAVRTVELGGQRSGVAEWGFLVDRRLREQWYFPGLVGVGMLALAAGVMAGWTRRERRRKMELERTIAERTEELSSANQELQRLNLRRVEFIGAVSHELRTPLAGARFLIQQLRAQAPTEPGSTDKAVDKLEQCLEELSGLLDGTLDLSRFELGLIPVELRWGKLEQLLSSSIDLFRPLAESKGLRFDVSIEHGENWLLCDAPNLRRIVANLLSNAVKYTDSGSISLRAQWSRIPNNDPEIDRTLPALSLVVSDTGVGMGEAQAEGITESFRRVSADAEEQRGAAGLGLALGARLVNLAGGRMTCSSQLGAGTTMSVTLPTWIVAGDGLGEEPPVAPFEFSALIVEDEPAHAAHATEVLEALGGVVSQAASVVEAAAMLRNGSFDLLCCDFNLPDGTALDLGRNVPTQLAQVKRAVVVSSLSTPAVIELCRNAGFADVLKKPFSVGGALEQARHFRAAE